VPTLGRPVELVQVADDSGNGLLSGAVWYEDALASPPDIRLPEPCSDDLFLIYTGGTTGMPKGVMWRQGDLFVRALPAAPFMHAAAQWIAFQALHAGGTVILPEHAARFDAADIVRVVAEESVDVLQIVGDPFAVPLVEAMRNASSPSPLKVVASGGALFRDDTKRELVALVPGLKVRDTMGASETGPQAQTTAARRSLGTFDPSPGACVLAENRTNVAGPDEIGWLATAGRVPLGYLGDAAKTATTFPLIGGRRMAVPGDRARRLADGSIEVLGRDSTTINTGGEKVYAQEVEAALAGHPSIADVLVVGRPNRRFGHEVVAVVELAPGRRLTLEDAAAYCETQLAQYKKPRALVVDTVRRSDAGKPDYRWAAEIAADPAADRPNERCEHV
jgi:fatty-acyl-CoA synthase